MMEMARKGRKSAADPKPRVAGEPKFRLGPVGPEGPAEAFDFTVAPESPNLLQKLLSKLVGARDYSQPVEPRQKALERELGEAQRLLDQISEALSRQSKGPEELPSAKKEIQNELIDKEAKRKRIRKAVAPKEPEPVKVKEPEPEKPSVILEAARRLKEKKARIAEAAEAAATEPVATAFDELEAATMKQFPYPQDAEMIQIYEQLARSFEKELGAPENYIRPEAVHTLIHSRVDPAFNKFYDSIVLVDEEGGEVEFTGDEK